MKKLLVLFLLVSCFVLVGCGKTEEKENPSNGGKDNTIKDGVLTCSKRQDADIDFDMDMEYYYKNDIVEKINVKYAYDLSSYTEEQRKAFSNSKLCETDIMKNTLGIEGCKEELDGTKYIVSGTAKKLLATQPGSLETVKKSLESDEFTCVIK